jgi:hypothetical protein
MAERGMPQVVGKRQRLRVLLIQVQCGHNGTRDLRDFDGVRQPIAEMIAKPGRKNLGFALQPTKCPGMNDAVAIPLEIVAIGMWGFRKLAPAQAFWT